MSPNDPTFEELCELFNYTPKGRFLDTNDAAEILGVSKSTLEHMRVRGDGPRYFQPVGNRRVFYTEPDVLKWLASGEKRSTSENVA